MRCVNIPGPDPSFCAGGTGLWEAAHGVPANQNPPSVPCRHRQGRPGGGQQDGLEPRVGKGPASPATGLAPSTEAPVLLTQTLELSAGSGVIFIYFLH